MTGKAAHPQEIASSLVRFDRYLDYAVRTLLKERVGFFYPAQREAMSGVVSILPCAISCRISAQSQASTPPVLKIRFFPYISGRGIVCGSS